MSMTLDLVATTHGLLDHTDFAQSVEYLARRGSRRSTHIFFFGGGAGMLLWIPLLALGFLFAFLRRNPDKASEYKERLKNGFAGVSARPPSAGAPTPYAGSAPTDRPLLIPGAPGRPPRLSLPMHPDGATVQPPPRPDVSTPASHPAAPYPPSSMDAGISAAAQPIPRVTAPQTASPRPAAVGHNTGSATSQRFNPPPNWPLPAGFTPGPHWRPDPSWPPAPAGWTFWIARN